MSGEKAANHGSRSFLLWCDGGSRGNPGPGAAGAVIKSADGLITAEESRYLGRVTNNEAEYEAVLLGLEASRRLGATEVRIHLDSELLVMQLLGKYRVKSPNLIPLYQKAVLMLRRFDAWSVQHIRRELNSQADQLVNATLDKHARSNGPSRR